MKTTTEKSNDTISVLHICGHNTTLIKSKDYIIIKSRDKYDFLEQIWLILILLPIVCIISLLFVAIILFIRNIFEVTALSILFLLIFIPGLFLAGKIFIWVQALLFGFNLSLTSHCIKGRWGIIPFKRKISDDSKIILSLAYMRGDWGCRGKIKFSSKDIFPVSLFLPYVISSNKSTARRELCAIFDWLSSNLPTMKIVVNDGKYQKNRKKSCHS